MGLVPVTRACTRSGAGGSSAFAEGRDGDIAEPVAGALHGGGLEGGEGGFVAVGAFLGGVGDGGRQGGDERVEGLAGDDGGKVGEGFGDAHGVCSREVDLAGEMGVRKDDFNR